MRSFLFALFSALSLFVLNERGSIGGTDPNLTDPPADPNDPPANPTPPVDDAADRIKRDLFRQKEENRKLQEQIDNMKLQGHKEKDDWKTIAQLHEEKAKDYEQKYTGLQSALINEKKISALTIEAQRQGINPASLPDLELLDFDEVTVETTSTGKILVSGQDRAIAKLKTLRPHWFTNSVPSVNPASPQARPANPNTVTVADLNAAEAQYNKTKSESDKKTYFDLIQKFKSQRT